MMEEAPEPAPQPSRRRRVLLALLIAVVVVAAGFFVWWEFLRPRSIAEVFAFEHFQPGTAVAVAGTITGIDRENTSYGPKVFLTLDHSTQCNGTGQVFGDPNATYMLGETFQTTLHFQSSTINGDPAVSAPELACPFPGGFTGIADVYDAVSTVRGILLVYNGSEPGGWQDYEVFTQNGVGYNLSALPVVLLQSTRMIGNNPVLPAGSTVDSAPRWATLLAVQYIGSIGPSILIPVIDQMHSLRDGTSVNGSLRFIDTNADGVLDNGDRLDVRLPAPGSSSAWSTYMVQIGELGGNNETYVSGEHFILDGPQGPLEPLLSSERPRVDLAYAGTQPGPPLQTTVQVTSVRIGPALPLTAIRYIFTDWTDLTQSLGNLTALPATFANGATLSFTDPNHDNLLDAGDRFTVTGVANRTDLSLTLLDPHGGIGEMDWIAGYGSVVGVVPYPTFTGQGSGPWKVTASVPAWSPEFAFNRTLRVSLLENGRSVITNASLANGTLGTFANGSLSFTDADGNGYLSTGDYLTLTGNPANSYELDVTFRFGAMVVRTYL